MSNSGSHFSVIPLMNLPLLRHIIPLLLLLSYQFGFSQSCNIQSDSVVCKDDFIGFAVQISGGQANSYSWNLGDAKTSTLNEPIAQYDQFGSKQISVQVILKNGGTCTASKSIYVHDRPVAKLHVLSTSSLCFSNNQVCIVDSSGPGKTGSNLVKRTLLWGDGYAETVQNPSNNSTACYSYPGSGKFMLVMEITDSKGCYSRSEDSVEVYHEAPAKFAHEFKEQCDSVVLCLNNQSGNASGFDKWYWDFGDGTIDSVNWNPPCHVYRDSGAYSVSLIVKNGGHCLDTIRKPGLVYYKPIHFNPVIPVNDACVFSTYTMDETWDQTSSWEWHIQIGSNWERLSKTKDASYYGDIPGKFALRLQVSSGNCKKTLYPDSLTVRGPIARYSIRNLSICSPGDSSYFCNSSDLSYTIGIKHYWDFGDMNAQACTTNTAQNQNTTANCNYSSDKNPKHLYTAEDCYFVNYIVRDTVTGCVDSSKRNILVGTEDPNQISLDVISASSCTGINNQARVRFIVGTCGEYMLNQDSARGGGWIKNQEFGYYPTTVDTTGWVTIGVVLLGNDSNSCPGITSKPICTDTIWYHRKIQLNKHPVPELNTIGKACFGEDILVGLTDTNKTHLKTVMWDWGDSTYDTLHYLPNEQVPVQFQHKYAKKGKFEAIVVTINDNNCENRDTLKLGLGLELKFVAPKTLCAGNCITVKDTTRYYADTLLYWKMAGRQEKVLFDWGDGSSDSNSLQKCYPQAGSYILKMIATDSTGCMDSVSQTLVVGGIKAGIRDGRDSLLCSEILQLFDSSTLLNPSNGEMVKSYSWYFGDGSRDKTVINPFHFYDRYGNFTIQYKVTTTLGCSDSISKQMRVIGPQPSFDFVTDTFGCVPLAVEMKNTSLECSKWIWYFGDPNNTTLPTKYDSNTVFTYDQPGVYTLQLYGADSVNNLATGNRQFCSATYPYAPQKRQVVVLPKPPVKFIAPAKVCVNQYFSIVSQADNIYNLHNWDFGDGSSRSSSAKVQRYAYSDGGQYTITYKPSYPPHPVYGITCPDSASRNIIVTDIKADFAIDSLKSGPLHFQFINLSANAVSYDWSFHAVDSGLFSRSNEVHPKKNFFPNQGRFEICLTATNAEGCQDSTCKTFSRSWEPYLFIPNVFTPGDKDQINDAFDIDIRYEESYHCRIYNRFGQLVFEGFEDGEANDGINWRGTLPDDMVLPAGVYYVIFDYKFYYREPQRYTGTVTIIR